MTTSIQEAPSTSPATVDDALAALGETIRAATVQVRGEGPGGGSGVIWDADGLIITNAHVAHGDKAVVELHDGRIFDAVVTARDPRRDLAALQIEASGLPALPIGDSAHLRVGQLMVAVGNPLGIVGALTMGIVHAIGPADDDAPLPPNVPGAQPWVQADVSLAPGNSGGPLTDAEGRVVGINAMIAGGLALAVPSAAVTTFLQRRARRPQLGVLTQPVILPIPGGRAPGLVVLETTLGGAADQAGVITGDVLIGAGGVLFRRHDDLLDALYRAGDSGTLRLEIVRGGVRMSLTATLDDAAATTEAA